MVKSEIAKYMEKKGIKKIYISRKTGMSPQSIGMMLKGERNLDIEEYKCICDALDVEYDFFLKPTVPTQAS